MTRGLTWALMAVAGLCASGATAETYKVEKSIEITSPPGRAWDIVGDFCDLDDWHPMVSGCRLKVIDGALHRVVSFVGGGEAVEKRIAVEPGLSYTYSIVEAPLPVENYTSTLSITRGDTSVITWSGRFSSDDPAAEGMIAGIYEAGLSAIEQELAK